MKNTDLFADIPDAVRLKEPLNLPAPLSEPELIEELKKQSKKNVEASPFLGAGCYQHFIPSVVKHLVSRSEFYTAYTPYQAEASQGILQTIYEYQSMVCELTAMDVANASMYDGATAMAEAAFMSVRITGKKKIMVSATVNPFYRQVLKTYADAADLKLVEVHFDLKTGLSTSNFSTLESAGCFILQQPNFFGNIEDVSNLAEKIHAAGALFIVSVDPISLGLLKPPGEYGADIVVGEGQALGNPQNFGGPGLGIFAAKKEYLRQMPGRIVGATTDGEGKRGYVLTLATREQHIRRERATSNICSNEALNALAACVYLAVMGKQGLRKVAELCLQKANYLKRKLGNKVFWPKTPIFKELVVKTDKNFGVDLSGYYPDLKGSRLICVTELIRKEDLDKLIADLTAS
ncbi:MAG: aminomethyl-transferring glycine dehydrogenase subunit GcvPA [Candidatus Margulisiibacteriota bacterium]